MKHILKWNYSLALFLSYYGQIIMFSSFEFRTLDLINFEPIMSFLLCCGLNILSIFLIFKMLSIISAIRKVARGANQTVSSELYPVSEQAKWKNFAIIFEEFKDRSFLHQAYLPVSIIRIYIFYLTISYLCSFPLAQMIIITLLSIVMLLYIAVVQSPKERADLIGYLIPELILLVVNILVLVLAILDRSHIHAENARNIIGEIIVGINTALCVGGSIFLLVKTILTIFFRIKRGIEASRERRKIHSNASQSGSKTVENNKASESGLNSTSKDGVLNTLNQTGGSNISIVHNQLNNQNLIEATDPGAVSIRKEILEEGEQSPERYQRDQNLSYNQISNINTRGIERIRR